MFCQFFLFLGFWFLVSGTFDWQHLIYGSIASLFVVVLWRGKSERVVARLNLRRLWMGMKAFCILLREIWIASWQVARLVLSSRMDISPTLVRTKSKLKHDRMRMLYANSITLTPGTLTVQLKDNCMLIHALTRKAGEDVVSWHFQETLKRLEDGE